MRAYCARMATAGSTRAARRAGIQHANRPMAAINTATPTNVLGSCGATLGKQGQAPQSSRARCEA
jgi:hypothetical protein